MTRTRVSIRGNRKRKANRSSAMSTLRGIAIGICIGFVAVTIPSLSTKTRRSGNSRHLGGGVRVVSPAGVEPGVESYRSEDIGIASRSLRALDELGQSADVEEMGALPSVSHEGSEIGDGLVEEASKKAEVEIEGEEEEGEEEGEEGEEEEEIEPALYSTVVMGIVLLLILLTIGFEELKEGVEEAADEDSEPIIESLFGEMTVLGFLSVCTFVLGTLKPFTDLSIALFDEAETLMEVLEFCHYTLFFVMIVFVVQVLVLMKEAGELNKKWMQMDALAQNPKAEPEGDMITFTAMRKEFLLERSVDYPYKPTDAQYQLHTHFGYGSYLAKCLGKMLQHVVNVEPMAWAFFAVFTIVVYGVNMLSGNSIVITAWFWAAVGWAVMYFNIVFERHLLGVRDFMIPKSTKDVSSNKMESDHLLPVEDTNGETLPPWTAINVEEHAKTRTWFAQKVHGQAAPLPMHSLFWFEKKGPVFYDYVLQINLVFTGLYVAMLLLLFFESMWIETSVVMFALYIIFSTIPAWVLIFSKKNLVAVMVQVTASGVRRPQVISDVLREEKTAKAVRAFVVLYKMRRAVEMKTDTDNESSSPTVHYSAKFNPLELQEVSSTFDSFDLSGDGEISTEEFGTLMASFGAPLEEDKLREMVAIFDTDGDGEVSKEEFLQWYADTGNTDDSTMHEKADFLFKQFDSDGSGELSIGEFSDIMKAFNIGLTIDEIGQVVNELDKDGNGEIGVDEFEEMLEKFYPKELE